MWRAIALTVLWTACAQERERPEPGVTGRIHPPGILEEGSDNFHGKELARRDYDFELCAKCHGEDFTGGAANVSCLECHDDGPTACATCHRDDVERGAHSIHRISNVACSECHAVPESWASEGHIRREGKADLGPAEVVFGARAAHTIDPADRAGAPAFANGTCTNVYCHGAVLGASGGTATAPRWVEPAASGCDRCHGSPPPSHAQAECVTCHPSTAPHIDGAIQVGRTNGCDGCHGRNGDPAPPTDLAGNEFTTAFGVGAHQAHLTVPTQLRGPLVCSDCHVVPLSVTATGHIDSPLPAEVVPATGWNRTTGTCTTWCHGGDSPIWTAQGAVTCGSCHAVPPPSQAHAGVTSVQSCASCHPGSAHMDGDVDVF
jgi:predicted CxxxxCH...CXXCH cytochrome family protein